MAQQLNPYITFPGTAEEALSFYATVLGGEPQVVSFRESGMDADGVMHGTIVIPLERQMWGDLYGQVADRFDITWHVNIATPEG